MIHRMTLMTAKAAVRARMRPTAWPIRWLKVGGGFRGPPRGVMGWGWWLAPARQWGQPPGLEGGLAGLGAPGTPRVLRGRGDIP